MTAHPIEALVTADVLGPLNEVEKKNAPPTLFFSGDRDLLKAGRRVSVVGSRAATPEGLARARSVTSALVDSGITVVSGLALGVDTVAHHTAIDRGGRTIAVLGTPLDRPYPPDNEQLFRLIARDHLVVSQFAAGTKTTPKCFPIRNRTMALLSDATIIVEASESSGTLHQGWEALRLGRLLFILESVVNDATLEWPKKMISYGAQVLSRQNFGRVRRDIPTYTATSAAAF